MDPAWARTDGENRIIAHVSRMIWQVHEEEARLGPPSFATVSESVCEHFSVEVYNQYRALVQQVYETENARHEGVCREPFACLRESCVHCIDQLNFPEQERVERIARLLVQQWDMNETSMTEMQRRIHGHFGEPQYAGKHLYAGTRSASSRPSTTFISKTPTSQSTTRYVGFFRWKWSLVTRTR